MSTPVREHFPDFEDGETEKHRSPSDDGTLKNVNSQDEKPDKHIDDNHLRVVNSYTDGPDNIRRASVSPARSREMDSSRFEDDLEMLRAERAAEAEANEAASGLNRHRSRSRGKAEPADDFDVGTTPIHETAKIYQPPQEPATGFAKAFKRIHESTFLVRYFFYISPIVIILLIPLLLGALVFHQANVGGVELRWFMIWLEIVWLSLWAGRILAKCIPYPMGLIASIFTNNSKKWRDLGKALEVPATLFFWWLAIEISFLPTMNNHHIDGSPDTKSWEHTLNVVIISIFVGTILNFIEKILIQLIAISFHLRTYSDRIEINKFQIGSLTKLYIHSKDKIAMEDSEFEIHGTNPSSGARTPMQYLQTAQKNAKVVLTKAGDIAGKVAQDFTGRQAVQSTHPHQVILNLLGSTSGSQVLARRLYRTFAGRDSDTILPEDLRSAFENKEEADAAFAMFDKDLNGDISMEELEAVCVEIGRERKAITASLKDLDSVVSKLDHVLFFIVAVITLIVFISLISTSAAGVLTSAGSTVLALSWLFSATAQEFLQSLIFVFVKHPFDVGDRVHIYGNTGNALTGDDYFVKEISLLYTEFKKTEGHVVQAPNSYLNTLFILNQRRSGGLAEGVPITVKFDTTLEQIDALRGRLLDFVTAEHREYQKNILTELTTIYEAYSITISVVFFYKSNWQNELLRLQRRNKFICAMLVCMQELGIEGPRMRIAGQTEQHPLHLAGGPINPNYYSPPTTGDEGPGPRSGSLARGESREGRSATSPGMPPGTPPKSHPSILKNSNARLRGETIAQMGRRVDFSLGMSRISSGDTMGDVFDAPRPRIPIPPSHSASTARDRRASAESFARNNLAETSSRESSDNASQRTHRNRFFGRAKSKLGSSHSGVDDLEIGTDMQDLETGNARVAFSRADMPDIPEASGAATDFQSTATTPARRRSGTASEVQGGSAAAAYTRTDPRSATTSPVAMRDDGPAAAPKVGPPKRAMTDVLGRKKR